MSGIRREDELQQLWRQEMAGQALIQSQSVLEERFEFLKLNSNFQRLEMWEGQAVVRDATVQLSSK